MKRGNVKSLSIAVLVDGKYSKNSETGLNEYSERSSEELEKFKTLIASAVGVDFRRGDNLEVVSLKFANENIFDEPESNEEWFKANLEHLLKTIIIGIIVVLIILLIVRPIIMHMLESGKKAALDFIPQYSEQDCFSYCTKFFNFFTRHTSNG